MTSVHIAVTLAGVAAIVWVNWYFFLAAQRPVAAAAGGTGPQTVRIVVEGGYSPSVVTVEAGRPVRL
jgi:plastocyanin domain-containing protein